MRTALHALSLVSSAAAQLSPYQPPLDALYAQADADADSVLSLGEFGSAVGTLGLEHDALSDAGLSSLAQLHHAADNSPRDGGLSTAEVVGMIDALPLLGSRLVGALSNEITGLSAEVGSGAPPAVRDSLVVVELVLRVAGTIAEIFPGTRRAIRAQLARLLSVSLAQVVLTFLPGSVVLTARVFVADGAQAAAVTSAARSRLGTAAQATEALGIDVLEAAGHVSVGWQTLTATTRLRTAPPIEKIRTPAIAGPCIVFGSLCVVAYAVWFARRERRVVRAAGVRPADDAGHRAGCCSFYALRAWSQSTLLSLIPLGVGCALLYVRVQAVTRDLSCALRSDARLRVIGGAAASAAASLPMAEVERTEGYYEWLPVVAVAPGCTALALSLTAGGLFHLRYHPTGRREFTAAKWTNFAAQALLLPAATWYAILVAVGYAIDHPAVQKQVRQIAGTCDTTLPMLEQSLADARAQRDRTAALLSAGGGDARLAGRLAELTASHANAADALAVFGAECGCLDQLMADIATLLGPGALCLCAVLFSLIALNGLCCAVRCCRAPRSAKVADGEAYRDPEPMEES